MKKHAAVLMVASLVCAGCDSATNAVIGSKRTAQNVSQKVDFRSLHDYMFAEHLQTGKWPTSQAEFEAMAQENPSLRPLLVDPWDNPIQYTPPTGRDGKPGMSSMGRDGVAGTPDDIVFEWPSN